MSLTTLYSYARTGWPPGSAPPGPPRGLDSVRDAGGLYRLLGLLWHPEEAVRKRAAGALPGAGRRHADRWSLFAGALLRELGSRSSGAPACPDERHAMVSESARAVLNRCAADLRGMANMHYSFLSSGLYLALVSTCSDSVQTVRRLGSPAAHVELCRLLWELSHESVIRRLNSQDAEELARGAGEALASLPPDEIVEYWRGLRHADLQRRSAYASALWAFRDRRAVPHLCSALPGQTEVVASAVAGCLGQIGDASATPHLQALSNHWSSRVRSQANTAIHAIARAQSARPCRTLLRPSLDAIDMKRNLLRALGRRRQEEPDELLRSLPRET